MDVFWNGFNKVASMRFGGYALNLVRQSAKKPTANIASRAAQAATAAAKATKNPVAVRQSLSASAQNALKDVPVRAKTYAQY